MIDLPEVILVEDDSYSSMIESVFEHSGNDCTALHNFFDNRGEIRKDNLEWLVQHPMPNKAACTAFTVFLNHFVDNCWLELLWERFVDGRMNDFKEKRYCNKVYYAAMEIMNGYSNGIPFELVKEYCEEFGDNPSKLSIVLHDCISSIGKFCKEEAVDDKEEKQEGEDEKIMLSELEQALEAEKEQNKQLMSEIKNLNAKIGEYLIQITQKDDDLDEICSKNEQLQKKLQEDEEIISDLRRKKDSLKRQIQNIEDTEQAEGSRQKDNPLKKYNKGRKVKSFQQLDEVKQREQIVKLVLENQGKGGELSIVKLLLDDGKISNEFLYTFLLDYPNQRQLEDLLVLLGYKQDNCQPVEETPVSSEVPGKHVDRDVLDLSSENKADSGVSEVSGVDIVVEDSDEEDSEDDYY